MAKIRLEVVLNRHPRGIFVEITVDGKRMGMRNIGGEVESLLGREWTKEKTDEGYLLSMEFEGDVDIRMEMSRSGNGKCEYIYLRNIK